MDEILLSSSIPILAQASISVKLQDTLQARIAWEFYAFFCFA
jgi:hypothetical protein